MVASMVAVNFGAGSDCCLKYLKGFGSFSGEFGSTEWLLSRIFGICKRSRTASLIVNLSMYCWRMLSASSCDFAFLYASWSSRSLLSLQGRQHKRDHRIKINAGNHSYLLCSINNLPSPSSQACRHGCPQLPITSGTYHLGSTQHFQTHHCTSVKQRTSLPQFLGRFWCFFCAHLSHLQTITFPFSFSQLLFLLNPVKHSFDDSSTEPGPVRKGRHLNAQLQIGKNWPQKPMNPASHFAMLVPGCGPGSHCLPAVMFILKKKGDYTLKCRCCLTDFSPNSRSQ